MAAQPADTSEEAGTFVASAVTQESGVVGRFVMPTFRELTNALMWRSPPGRFKMYAMTPRRPRLLRRRGI
jgi:hypothetical protein